MSRKGIVTPAYYRNSGCPAIDLSSGREMIPATEQRLRAGNKEPCHGGNGGERKLEEPLQQWWKGEIGEDAFPSAEV